MTAAEFERLISEQKEEEQELNEIVEYRTTEIFRELRKELIKTEMQRLFGPDVLGNFNALVKNKQGIDPEKINAFRDYVKDVTRMMHEAFKQAISI